MDLISSLIDYVNTFTRTEKPVVQSSEIVGFVSMEALSKLWTNFSGGSLDFSESTASSMISVVIVYVLWPIIVLFAVQLSGILDVVRATNRPNRPMRRLRIIRDDDPKEGYDTVDPSSEKRIYVK